MSSEQGFKLDFSRPCKVYFAGIGGISMSGLAQILKNAGFDVCGSDRDKSEITEKLEKEGIKIFYGQKKENITPDIDCVVFSAAIHPDNPEYCKTMELGLPHLWRGELLGQMMKNYRTPIAVSGTHGKTTTTSMISEILLAAGVDPTINNGGVLKSIGGNTRVGAKDYFVVEACEYTNSFLQFFPRIGVIMNVEEDHLDFFKDLDDIRASFRRFAELLPSDGTLVICGEIENWHYFTQSLTCKVLTFSKTGTDSYGEKTDYSAKDIEFNAFGCAAFTAVTPYGERNVTLKVPGEHNVTNCLAALAVSDSLGIDPEKTLLGISGFTGADRRFEYKGEVKGFNIVDDYAHHPTEIEATMSVAKKIEHNRLFVVFQSHTYTRTKAFFDDFVKALSQADVVIMPDIYPARETDNLGISSADLCASLEKMGTRAIYIPEFEKIEKYLLENCTKGDLVITLGAGEAYKIGDALLAGKS
ncbi:MAG: UDP-N-acetylmuramate--L-alanine ligase [Lachnospiraceae bacterium]|nr:UDP-N-acetylmuramate--L-alanine ligase [Lachnospiraceae bacterium]